MSDIRIYVRGVPVPQGSTRAFVVKGRAITTNKTPAMVAWRTAIAEEARATVFQIDADRRKGGYTISVPGIELAPFQLLEGALQVSCYFQFTSPKSRKKQGMTMYSRPDIDKLLRAVLDALTGVIWHDDAQVCILRGQKVYSDPPGCKIVIRQCFPDMRPVDGCDTP